jgi:5-hydroxyisourate hydrolase
MSPITTHVLDTSLGRPAAGVAVVLDRQNADDTWTELGRGATNADGRLTSLLAENALLNAGVYRLRFMTGAYFAASGVKGFYPEVPVHFRIDDPSGHYHVPLLLSPFGYSTYRGS